MKISSFIVGSLSIAFASAALSNLGHNPSAHAPIDDNEEGVGRLPLPRIPIPSNGNRFTLARLRGIMKDLPTPRRISISIFEPRDKTITSIWTDDRYMNTWNGKGRRLHVYYGNDLTNIAKMRFIKNGGKAVYEYRPIDPLEKPEKPRRKTQRRFAAFRNWAEEAKSTVQSKVFKMINRVYLNMQVHGISPYEAITEADMMRLVRLMTGTGDTVYFHYGEYSITKRNLVPDGGGKAILYQGSQKYVSPAATNEMSSADESDIQPKQARLISLLDEPQRKGKRDNFVIAIANQESSAVAGSANTTTDTTAEFALIWDAFQTVQSNISDTIFPFLEAMTNNTNSSLIYEAAWSIWADLTASNEYPAGPFSHGMHSLDALEDAYLKANNVTEDDPEFQDMLVVNAILLDSYTTTWNQAFAAVNGSGLIEQLETLAGYLLANNTAAQPAVFFDSNQPRFDDGYFLAYNHSVTMTT